MDKTSFLQSAFLKKHRQHHHLVLLLRLLGCILFLGPLGDQHPSVLDRLLHLQQSFRNP